MQKNIIKLYLSNILMGMVFWYGIEKLFMQSIGIDAFGVAVASAVFMGTQLLFDIPSGVLADRWSRKGMLVLAAGFSAGSSIVCGLSNGLPVYVVGIFLYGLYLVSASGTYQAIMYDTLAEARQSRSYDKIMGRARGLFWVGTGVGNVLGGFIAHATSYRTVFLLSVVPCVINICIVLSLREPRIHKAEEHEPFWRQFTHTGRTIVANMLLRTLAVVLTVLATIELFQDEYGQLIVIQHTSSPEVLGTLWGLMALAGAVGYVVAHRLHARLTYLVVLTALSLVLLAGIDNFAGVSMLIVLGVFAAALHLQIETRVQDATSSRVRASVLSVLSTAGTMVGIPASLCIGWTIRGHGVAAGVWLVAGLAVAVCIYWLIASRSCDHTKRITA